MDDPLLRTETSDLIETLAVASDPEIRHRILLEAALTTGAARAAAIWRPVPGGDPDADPREAPIDQDERWIQLLARGPRSELPDDLRVLAVLEGGLDGHLGESWRVVRAGRGLDRIALALGGVAGEDEATDLLEALLAVFSCVDSASRPTGDDSRGALEHIPTALPGSGDGEETAGGFVPDLVLRRLDDPRLEHDLRNLLAGVSATRDLLGELRDRPDSEEPVLEVVRRECGRVAALLLEALGGRAAETLDDPQQVVSDSVFLQREACADENIELELIAGCGEVTPPIELGGAALARIVSNLVVNARRALLQQERRSPTTQRITVQVLAGRGGHSGLLLRVEDRGPGFPEELLPDVFRAGVSSEPGRGLGLAAVAELVQAAGGHVRASNRPRGGARVEVWIPARGSGITRGEDRARERPGEPDRGPDTT